MLRYARSVVDERDALKADVGGNRRPSSAGLENEVERLRKEVKWLTKAGHDATEARAKNAAEVERLQKTIDEFPFDYDENLEAAYYSVRNERDALAQAVKSERITANKALVRVQDLVTDLNARRDLYEDEKAATSRLRAELEEARSYLTGDALAAYEARQALKELEEE
jgi:chromosome segregation ATPase